MAVVLLATAACGDDSDDDAVTESLTEEGSTEAAEGDDQADGDGGTTEVTGQPTEEVDPDPAPNEPLAVVEGGGDWSELEITDLRLTGDVATVEFVIVADPAVGDASTQDVFNAAEDRWDGSVGMESQYNPRRRMVSGVTLVDTTNNQRHLVLRDSEGECLCTGFDDLAAPGRYNHSAQFAAPPEGVTSMTVQVPHFPAVDEVPLRRAG